MPAHNLTRLIASVSAADVAFHACHESSLKQASTFTCQKLAKDHAIRKELQLSSNSDREYHDKSNMLHHMLQPDASCRATVSEILRSPVLKLADS